MSYEEKNRFIDWLMTVGCILAILIILMWLFGGCSAASNNKALADNNVVSTRSLQERQVQVGLVNVASESDIWQYISISAIIVIGLLLAYKMVYHWKNSDRGKFLCKK